MPILTIDNKAPVRWTYFGSVTLDDGVEIKIAFLVDQEGPEMDHIIIFNSEEYSTDQQTSVYDAVANIKLEHLI